MVRPIGLVGMTTRPKARLRFGTLLLCGGCLGLTTAVIAADEPLPVIASETVPPQATTATPDPAPGEAIDAPAVTAARVDTTTTGRSVTNAPLSSPPSVLGPEGWPSMSLLTEPVAPPTPTQDSADRLAQEMAAIRERLGLNVLAGTIFDGAGDGPTSDEPFLATIRDLVGHEEQPDSLPPVAGHPFDRPMPPTLDRSSWELPRPEGVVSPIRPVNALSNGERLARADSPERLAISSSATLASAKPEESAWTELYRVDAILSQAAERLEWEGAYDLADEVRYEAERTRRLARKLRDRTGRPNGDDVAPSR